ncbi:putative atp-dependent clp protease proteolytic subunit [Phaeomoniella chlamydospora]|uniref:ATP-dependent Clp protease proteolytic subunit n=1 Tax=Phaeomoniella chlamydospora TaxID=158046 RepID=A0A0G2E7F9_PHACM|nr:putative atp-dependent clp protease proteolytic subunit [Phaeomoniella chlamydospora]
MYTPTPMIIETVSGGGQYAYDIFSKLLKERIICIGSTIDDTVSSVVTAQLLHLEADNPEKEIWMYINSPGGSVTSGLAIYDTMQYITSPVHTVALGNAASAASLLLAAGSPGKRYSLPNTSIMLHQPSGGFHGTAADIAVHAKEILRIREQLNKIYQKHFGIAGKEKSLGEIEKLLERDYFMTAEEALELGVVDEVLASRKALPSK